MKSDVRISTEVLSDLISKNKSRIEVLSKIEKSLRCGVKDKRSLSYFEGIADAIKYDIDNEFN